MANNLPVDDLELVAQVQIWFDRLQEWTDQVLVIMHRVVPRVALLLFHRMASKPKDKAYKSDGVNPFKFSEMADIFSDLVVPVPEFPSSASSSTAFGQRLTAHIAKIANQAQELFRPVFCEVSSKTLTPGAAQSDLYHICSKIAQLRSELNVYAGLARNHEHVRKLYKAHCCEYALGTMRTFHKCHTICNFSWRPDVKIQHPHASSSLDAYFDHLQSKWDGLRLSITFEIDFVKFVYAMVNMSASSIPHSEYLQHIIDMIKIDGLTMKAPDNNMAPEIYMQRAADSVRKMCGLEREKKNEKTEQGKTTTNETAEKKHERDQQPEKHDQEMKKIVQERDTLQRENARLKKRLEALSKRLREKENKDDDDKEKQQQQQQQSTKLPADVRQHAQHEQTADVCHRTKQYITNLHPGLSTAETDAMTAQLIIMIRNLTSIYANVQLIVRDDPRHIQVLQWMGSMVMLLCQSLIMVPNVASDRMQQFCTTLKQTMLPNEDAFYNADEKNTILFFGATMANQMAEMAKNVLGLRRGS